jgi:hypothetical protein
MTILQFRSRAVPRGWQGAEIDTLISACGKSLEKGIAGDLQVGETEGGEPQLYVLGPAPDYECILCISRVGRRYVIEDGQGHVLYEHGSLVPLSESVRTALRAAAVSGVACIGILWYAVKRTLSEKAEPLMAEPLELLHHITPQLAAIA